MLTVSLPCAVTGPSGPGVLAVTVPGTEPDNADGTDMATVITG